MYITRGCLFLEIILSNCIIGIFCLVFWSWKIFSLRQDTEIDIAFLMIFLSSRFWRLSCLHAFDVYLVFTFFMFILSSRFWRLSCLHAFDVYLVLALLMIILSSRFWRLSCLHAFDDFLVFTFFMIFLSSLFWRLPCPHAFDDYLVFILLPSVYICIDEFEDETFRKSM